MSHLITPSIKTLVQRVLNAAETGTPDGKYHDISIFADGKGGTRQITYGKSQTTEQGNLAELIRMYCEKGAFAAQFGPYLPLIGTKALVDDSHFKSLLVRAAKEDSLMKEAQDEFFDKVYWTPAFKWFTEHGFTLPLSMLVIYDSFIHSGGILPLLRKKFPELVPAKGGNEKEWIRQYARARHGWLAGHSKPILRKTIYRTNCYLGEIERNNWHLTTLPIRMNDIAVDLPAALREGPGVSEKPPAVTHLITPPIKTLVQRVLNAAETGTADGKYHAISIFADGKGGTRQITYGKSQTTEQGHLAKLIRMYCEKGGAFAAQFEPYLPLIGGKPLVDDSKFKDLLVRAAREDPLMKEAQDEFFDKVYWTPAFKWFAEQRFTLPLSMLVIYDSFIHSGSILPLLRKKFAEPVPAKGGDEKKWIQQYAKARHEWLAGHSKPILRKTIYRMNCYLGEIERNNWHLTTLPIRMNDIAVDLPAALREVPGVSEEPPAVSHLITPPIKTLVQRVLNAAETGTADGRYHAISIFADGKGGTRQITYGKSQTTEQGHLAKLIRMYCEKGGAFAAQFEPYLPLIGGKPLVDDSKFKDLLVRAAREDPLMKEAQDEFFDRVYWTPAFKWFAEQGFTLPLSMLVIYDSFIHSGSILPLLRKKFAEPVPAKGGDEKKWIQQYAKARHEWLAGHSKPILRKTIYRTNCYLGEIERNNWHLTVLPIRMNGIAVHLPPALREGPGAIV